MNQVISLLLLATLVCFQLQSTTAASVGESRNTKTTFAVRGSSDTTSDLSSDVSNLSDTEKLTQILEKLNQLVKMASHGPSGHPPGPPPTGQCTTGSTTSGTSNSDSTRISGNGDSAVGQASAGFNSGKSS